MKVLTFTTKAPPLLADWSPDRTTAAPQEANLDFIPKSVTPQRCSILKVDKSVSELLYDDLVRLAFLFSRIAR